MSQGRFVGFFALLLIGSAMAHGWPTTEPDALPAARQTAGPPKTNMGAADKGVSGTVRPQGSHVWYRLRQGRLSEVYYPDLSTPNLRTLELVITDGRTFTDRESEDTWDRTFHPDAGSRAYTQVNMAKSGKYRITKRFVADPHRDAVEMRVLLESLDGRRLTLFALYDPALHSTATNDRGRSVGHTLVATDGASGLSSALRSRPAFGSMATGYLGSSDGWSDLKRDHRLDHEQEAARPGDIVQVARIAGVNGRPGHQVATLTLAFGMNAGKARRTAAAAAASWPR